METRTTSNGTTYQSVELPAATTAQSKSIRFPRGGMNNGYEVTNPSIGYYWSATIVSGNQGFDFNSPEYGYWYNVARLSSGSKSMISVRYVGGSNLMNTGVYKYLNTGCVKSSSAVLDKNRLTIHDKRNSKGPLYIYIHTDKDEYRKLEKKNVKVETISVGNTNLGGTKDYVGTIEEKMGSTLSFEIAGNITSIRVEEGDRVSKGQLLATINPTTVKEAHRATLTTLKQAQDAYRRFLPLHQSGTISDMKWVEIESKLEQAKAAESIARQQLSHSTLTAPFAGVIAAKNVDLGTYVLPGQPVLKLANVAQVNAKISVPETEISHLHVGDKVKLTVAALSGAIFRGTISEKGIDANPISHTYDVKVGITNPQGRLLPGMVCNAQVQGSAATPSHITVPPQSIELDVDNSRFVWTVVNGKAHQQPVTTGDFEGDGIVILSGLKAGDQVIINGQQKVSEGMNVDTAKSDNR